MSLTLQERYRPGSSPLHTFDPRIKLVVTLATIAGIVLTPETAWPAYPLLWALVASVGAVGQISPRRLARDGLIALPFALAAATLIVTTPGHVFADVLGITLTTEGLARFIAIVLKSWLTVQAAVVLAATTSLPDLLTALTALRVPATLVAITAFTYRYLFTLRDEAERLLCARAARSAGAPDQRAGGGLLWRARVAGGMVGSLFLRSYERSERIHAAMVSRGYSGRFLAPDPPPLRRDAVLWGLLPTAVLIAIELLAVMLWR